MGDTFPHDSTFCKILVNGDGQCDILNLGKNDANSSHDSRCKSLLTWECLGDSASLWKTQEMGHYGVVLIETNAAFINNEFWQDLI